MTSQEALRSWTTFMDHAEVGQLVTVSRRGRAQVIAVPWPRYKEDAVAGGLVLSDPMRVSSLDDDDAKSTWRAASLIVIESSVAKDGWRALKVWVENGGHAIIERYGKRTAVLTPVSWAREFVSGADDPATD